MLVGKTVLRGQGYNLTLNLTRVAPQLRQLCEGSLTQLAPAGVGCAQVN